MQIEVIVILIVEIVQKLNLDHSQLQKVFELSIAILWWSVADRIINFMVVDVASEIDIVRHKTDFLELIAFSQGDIGKNVGRLLFIGDTEWYQVL